MNHSLAKHLNRFNRLDGGIYVPTETAGQIIVSGRMLAPDFVIDPRLIPSAGLFSIK